MLITDVLIASAALFGAGLLGWFFRGRRHLTERRVHAELFSRQVRLAEQDADEAIKKLNENQVEMRGYQDRFEPVPVTEQLCQTVISIPLSAYMCEEDQDQVISTILSWADQRRRAVAAAR